MLSILIYSNETTINPSASIGKSTKIEIDHVKLHQLNRGTGAVSSGNANYKFDTTIIFVPERRSLPRRQTIACLDAPLMSSLATKCDASAYYPRRRFDKL